MLQMYLQKSQQNPINIEQALMFLSKLNFKCNYTFYRDLGSGIS